MGHDYLRHLFSSQRRTTSLSRLTLIVLNLLKEARHKRHRVPVAQDATVVPQPRNTCRVQVGNRHTAEHIETPESESS